MENHQADARVCYNAGIVAKAEGKVEISIESLSRAIQLDSKNVSALIELGDSYELTCQRDRALELYDRALTIEPNNALALVLKARTLYHYDSVQREQGRKLCQQSLGIIPRSDRVLAEAANLIMNEDSEKASLLIEEALSFNQESATALFSKGILAEHKGNLNEATILYESAIKRNAVFREQLYARVEHYCQLGLTEEAIVKLQTTLRFEQHNARYHRVHGRILSQEAKWDEATDVFSRALKIDHNDIESLVGLGRAKAHCGDHQGAMKEYRQALQVDSRCAEASANIAALYCDVYKDYKTALEFAEDAVRFNDKLMTGWINRGIILMHLGRADESLRAFDTALVIDPGNVLALLRKGALLCDVMGLHREATVCFNEALRIQAENVEAWWGLSQASMQMGELNAAVRYLDGLLAVAPSHVEAEWNRALLLLRLGRNREAREGLGRVSQLEPWNPRARIALQATEYFPDCPVPLEVAMLLRNVAMASEYARIYLRTIMEAQDPVLAKVFVLKTIESLASGKSSSSGEIDVVSLLSKAEEASVIKWLTNGGAKQLLSSLE